MLRSEEGGTCRFITLEEGQSSTEEEGVVLELGVKVFGKCEYEVLQVLR